ncbi:N-acetyltransferase [Martelella alba]|uniref:N-acetyltransferase n=1 Tax=Martelella alba TaxID=2590451 RepID=A0A506UK53_9HYPH|nr:N-acetyltransferase [Martelella alba]TPW33643.1 N-acetyltransferase [Martelella alba]
MIIRRERAEDVDAIYPLVAKAFYGHPHSDGSEPAIIKRLRKAGALSLALVAEEYDMPVGHVAFSPVGFADRTEGWYGVGPLAVHPDYQGKGIGTALMLGGLELLRDTGANGAILVGDPGFYQRFGFRAEPQITHMGVPAENLLALPFEGELPKGEVAFHKAFFGEI